MNYCNALAGSIATAKCRAKNRSLVHRIASTKISLLQAMNLQLDVNFCPDLLEYAAVSPMDRSLGSIWLGGPMKTIAILPHCCKTCFDHERPAILCIVQP
jgi:hypothetical protein